MNLFLANGIIAPIFFFLLTFCTNVPSCAKDESGVCRMVVLSTTAMIGDLVADIGGDHVVSKVLIQGFSDPHSYELVKGDGEKIQQAKIIFINGLGLEHGGSLQGALKKHANVVVLGDVINKNDLIIEEGVIDPHVWMDLSLFSLFPQKIAEELSAMDPMHEKEYFAKSKALTEQLLALNRTIFESMQSIPENERYLLTSHDAFNYYARRYLATDLERKNGDWKKRFNAPEGLAPESQIRLYELKKVVAHIEKYKIKILFKESNLSTDSLEKIIESVNEKGGHLAICPCPLYGDTLGSKNSCASSYLKMMEYNRKVIFFGLTLRLDELKNCCGSDQ